MYNKHLTTAKWDCKLNLRRGKNQLVPLFNKGREEIEGKKTDTQSPALTPHHTTHGSAFARYPITHLQSIAFQKINRFFGFFKAITSQGCSLHPHFANATCTHKRQTAERTRIIDTKSTSTKINIHFNPKNSRTHTHTQKTSEQTTTPTTKQEHKRENKQHQQQHNSNNTITQFTKMK